jgi:hypothetical protein
VIYLYVIIPNIPNGGARGFEGGQLPLAFRKSPTFISCLFFYIFMYFFILLIYHYIFFICQTLLEKIGRFFFFLFYQLKLKIYKRKQSKKEKQNFYEQNKIQIIIIIMVLSFKSGKSKIL